MDSFEILGYDQAARVHTSAHVEKQAIEAADIRYAESCKS
jgi:hypothetical protein